MPENGTLRIAETAQAGWFSATVGWLVETEKPSGINQIQEFAAADDTDVNGFECGNVCGNKFPFCRLGGRQILGRRNESTDWIV